MSVEVVDIAKMLGGRRTLGKRIQRSEDLQALIEQGLPTEVAFHVQSALALTDGELAKELAVTPRTLSRWRSTLKRRTANVGMPLPQGDRLYRLSRIAALAIEVLEDRNRAVRWLRRPQLALGGKTPLEKIRTESGAREVEDLLMRIEYGVVA